MQPDCCLHLGDSHIFLPEYVLWLWQSGHLFFLSASHLPPRKAVLGGRSSLVLFSWWEASKTLSGTRIGSHGGRTTAGCPGTAGCCGCGWMSGTCWITGCAGSSLSSGVRLNEDWIISLVFGWCLFLWYFWIAHGLHMLYAISKRKIDFLVMCPCLWGVLPL